MKPEVCAWCSYLERKEVAVERARSVVHGSRADVNATTERRTCGSRVAGRGWKRSRMSWRDNKPVAPFWRVIRSASSAEEFWPSVWS